MVRPHPATVRPIDPELLALHAEARAEEARAEQRVIDEAPIEELREAMIIRRRVRGEAPLEGETLDAAAELLRTQPPIPEVLAPEPEASEAAGDASERETTPFGLGNDDTEPPPDDAA